MSFGDVESGGSGRRGLSSWGSSPFSNPGSSNVDEEFNTLAKQVQTDIQQMASSIRVLRSSSQIVGTPRDTDDLRNQIRDTLHSAQSTARQLGTDIKKLLRLAGESSSHDMQTKRRRLAEKLKDDFEGQLREFREVGRTAAEKEKQALQTKQRTTGGGSRGGYGETTALLSQPSEDQRMQQFSLMQLDADVTFNENAAQGLEAEIKELETAVLELNDIFKDLSTLVYDQSVTIDSIEQHVESAVMYTDEGVIELNEARSQQSRSRMWLCCVGLLVCLLVTGAIIGIVLGVTLGGKNNDDNNKSSKTTQTTTTPASSAALSLL